jgi:hypothetical protein
MMLRSKPDFAVCAQGSRKVQRVSGWHPKTSSRWAVGHQTRLTISLAMVSAKSGLPVIFKSLAEDDTIIMLIG